MQNNTNNMRTMYSWLQLSDLHIFESTDWNIMMDAYRKLSNVIKPDFLVFTGDYRHKVHNNYYKNALSFLNEIVTIFNIKKENVFLVPGNHDVNDYDYRNEIISAIRTKISCNPDIYCKYITNGDKSLRYSFTEYNEFVREFYGDVIEDDRIANPDNVMCITWNNTVNIVILNTALISDGNKGENEIVDIRTLSQLCRKNTLPTIVLAHHAIDCLTSSHKNRIITILNNIKANAYLCGDKHKIEKGGIEKNDIPNSTIPQFVCGKSAIEVEDSFSDLGIIEYNCMEDGNTYVQVYKYIDSEFHPTPDFYYNVNKRFNFKMFEPTINTNDNVKVVMSRKINSKNKSVPNLPSIWLPDAELAKGKQTRFSSFTETDAIRKYFDNNSPYLGIVSAKGIGKTFVLQVKRVKSSRKYCCLPHCSTPSVRNNWATERISFDTYEKLKTENIYNDLVVLWKIAIKCYLINYFKDIDNVRTINEYVENKKLSIEIANLCISDHIDGLQSIMSNAIEINNWNKIATENYTSISNICRIVLHRRLKSRKSVKDIAIFIDKIDQAIKQTNAEPPANCVVCKKKNNYDECKSHKKNTEYCSNSSGCQSKNCCYGCEIFAGPKSNDGLRIYEYSNAAKLVHVNIWQYLQLALMHAAGEISDETNGAINVFYTIRQEAFNCEKYRLGEHNQKIAGKTIKLIYSIEEQENIFLDCIRKQEDIYLFKPELKSKIGFEEYAFIGVNKLCHPYCKNVDGSHQSESLFMSIYRHSFDRSRDIQRYGEELTKNMNYIRDCIDEHSREELVKQVIEDLAAKLAYCSKQSESTVNPSYYTEKMRYMPNYWADNDNFEHLLSVIDRNLLFEEDIKNICCIINGYDNCPSCGCRGGKCKRHPFSVLYNLGYLGYIVHNSNNNTQEIQQFLDAGEISYFTETDNLMTTERVAYIVHPALTKTIEKKYNKNFMHFSGFILGKGIKVESKKIIQVLEDKKNLSSKEFLSKYYFKP